MAKKKFYVVWKGKQPGIFLTWAECEKQIKGFPGAKYKSYPTKGEAETAYANEPVFSKKSSSTFKSSQFYLSDEIRSLGSNGPIYKSMAVDAACSGNPGTVEYRAVMVDSGKEIFKKHPMAFGTNNLGEFLGLVHGIAYITNNKLNIPLYSDSLTAMSWVKKKKVKSTLFRDSTNEEIWGLVDRAENYLKENVVSVTLLKWNTEKWGEIPADFGRK